MNIIEAAAKAHFEYQHAPDEFRHLTAEGKTFKCNQMRAALRAMAECEPSEAMQDAIFTVSSNPIDAARDICRALLLAAAEEE